MRYSFTIVVALLLFSSCKESSKEDKAMVKSKTFSALPINPEKVKGFYAGDFKGSPISLMLSYVSNRHVSGYDVHKGLNRNFTGSIEFTNGKLHLQLAEPGNNPFDGNFDLEIDTAKWTGKGVWKPMKKGEETSFTFRKRITTEEDKYNYGQTYIDSLSNYIVLKLDGSCTYTYLTDTTNTAQQNIVRGSYKKEAGAVTVYWQKNDAFPSGKSVFKLIVSRPYPDDKEYTEETLRGEGREFHELNGDL